MAKTAASDKGAPNQSRPAQPAGVAQIAEVYINERRVTPEQAAALKAMYGTAPAPGHYWYDSRSGLYGLWGREAAGYIHPGHDLGPLPANASAGDTGVFINGREINQVELNFLQILFNGQVRQGRAWLDGRTWNIGAEGNPYPIANLAAALQAQQSRGRRDWGWRDGSGATMASDGNCTMMSVPGAPTYATSGCN